MHTCRRHRRTRYCLPRRLRSTMFNQPTRIPPVKYSRVGPTYPSKFYPHLPVTVVYFSTVYGSLVYYDDNKKWAKAAQKQFHDDIVLAATGEIPGWFAGLSVRKRKNGDLYLELQSDYRLLT